ncbi:MAG: caspase family protein [Treponema sp.]|nr:caspase family protein [Treponema sp.]
MRKKIFIMLVAMAFSIVSVFSEARNALLIANGNYSHFSNLSTPVKEARELKNSLTQLGFSVTIVENASREKILDSLSDFEKILKSKGGIAFFHYGGHAVQVNGKNYLIPVNADIPDERRVATRAVDVDELMISMVADTNIVILDSCRNNPLPAANTREGTRGLVMATERPRNSIIVYSAQAGKTAQDGIFTPTLTKKILEKKSFTDILMDVRREVRSVTKNEQSPCEYNELEMPVYLAGNASGEQNYVSQTSSATSDSKTSEEYMTLGINEYEAGNHGKALDSFKKAANMGHAYAQFLVGLFYEEGDSVAQNFVEAAKWYNLSAQQGIDGAQYNLGDLYYSGKGVQQSYSEAKKWYLLAAEKGNKAAQYSLGWLFEHGQGVNKDTHIALSYYQMAANQGHEEAKKRIAAINGANSSNTSVQNNGQWLFPIYGLELGKSTLSEVRRKSESVFGDYTYSISYTINGHVFECNKKKALLTWVHFLDPKSHTWPQELTNKGYNPNYSYNQWKSFLTSQGYTINKNASDDDWLIFEKNTPIKHELAVSGFKNNNAKCDSLRIDIN